MRTDINKINEHTLHTGLTEGMQVFAAGTSKYFKTGEWRNNTPVYLEDNCCVHRSVRTVPFRSKIRNEEPLT